ncbi:MAG: hypothetical protein MUE88_07635 [Flavobacteriales bacterium]|nr:hypothetical protein [Flavobacteriales bacterium]
MRKLSAANAKSRQSGSNPMATYRANLLTGSLQVTERPIGACPEAQRGSSARLGIDTYTLEMAGDPPYDDLVDPAGLLNYELTDPALSEVEGWPWW